MGEWQPRKRFWTDTELRWTRPGIFVIGDGWISCLGVRYRIVAHHDGVWVGELDVEAHRG